MKGIQRKMILVRTPESRFFEEAHLVLRTDRYSADGDEDILKEANRIVEEARRSSEAPTGRKRKGARLGMLLLGVLCGGGTVGILWLLLTLL